MVASEIANSRATVSIEIFGEVQPSSVEIIQGKQGVDVVHSKCSGRQIVHGPGIV